MEKDKEKILHNILEQVSIEIKKILLNDFSKNRTAWIMEDVDHILFSHTENELNRLIINED